MSEGRKMSLMVKEHQQTQGKKEKANMLSRSRSLLSFLIPFSIVSFFLFFHHSYLSFQSLNLISKRTSTFISLNIISLFIVLLSKSSNTTSSMELPSESLISTSLEISKLAIDDVPAYPSCLLEKGERAGDKKYEVVVEEEEEEERDVDVVFLNEESDEELGILGIDELNERFEEFIRMEKKKWRMEAMKVGSYLDNGTRRDEMI